MRVAEINGGRSCLWDLLSSLVVVQRSVNRMIAATAVLWGFCQRKSSFILHREENARDVLISRGSTARCSWCSGLSAWLIPSTLWPSLILVVLQKEQRGFDLTYLVVRTLIGRWKIAYLYLIVYEIQVWKGVESSAEVGLDRWWARRGAGEHQCSAGSVAARCFLNQTLNLEVGFFWEQDGN